MKNKLSDSANSKKRLSRAAHRLVFLMMAFILCLTLGARAQEQSSVQLLRAYEEPDGLYLDVEMALNLSPELEEILQKGVALQFIMEVKVKRERWYWFDATDAKTSKDIKLSYQPLLQQYRVSMDGEGRSWATLQEALTMIDSVSHWKIMDSQTLGISGKKKLDFSFTLDRSQLPSSLQLSIDKIHEWTLELSQSVDLQGSLSEEPS